MTLCRWASGSRRFVGITGVRNGLLAQGRSFTSLKNLQISHSSLHVTSSLKYAIILRRPCGRLNASAGDEGSPSHPYPLQPPTPSTTPSADETAQFSHNFVTIINMKFPDSVTKAFNKKPKKIGLQELVPQAAIGWLGCRSVLMFLRRPPSSTFTRLAR